jgi:hypothetical protein
MNHLTDLELADAADGSLDPARAAHLADCSTCDDTIRELRGLLAEVTSVPADDPSPLFWDHFAARVRAAIDETPASGRSWFQAPRLAWLGAAAVVLVGWVGFQTLRESPDPPSSTEPATGAAVTKTPDAPTAGQPVDGADDDIPADDAAWALVSSLAGDLHYDDARDAGVLPLPGSVERAALEMSEDERAELVRLIKNELKRMGA